MNIKSSPTVKNTVYDLWLFFYEVILPLSENWHLEDRYVSKYESFDSSISIDWKCLSPSCSYLKPYIQCDLNWWWAFGSWLESMGGALLNEVSALMKQIQRDLASFLPQWEDSNLWSREHAGSSHWIHQCFHLGFSSLLNCEEYIFIVLII